MSSIQFLIDLIWDLVEDKTLNGKQEDEIGLEKMDVDSTNEENFDTKKRNIILLAIMNLVKLIDELNLFNIVDDQKNDNIFKNWSKNFVPKTYQSIFK
jgi:hypothetical protein